MTDVTKMTKPKSLLQKFTYHVTVVTNYSILVSGTSIRAILLCDWCDQRQKILLLYKLYRFCLYLYSELTNFNLPLTVTWYLSELCLVIIVCWNWKTIWDVALGHLGHIALAYIYFVSWSPYHFYHCHLFYTVYINY